jgi:hypothetical protein
VTLRESLIGRISSSSLLPPGTNNKVIILKLKLQIYSLENERSTLEKPLQSFVIKIVKGFKNVDTIGIKNMQCSIFVITTLTLKPYQ